jgi:hypothetical protein
LPEGHLLALIDRMQSRNRKVLTLIIVVILLTGGCLFVWSSLSADTVGDGADSLLLFCVFVLFLDTLPRGRLLLALYELPKLSSIWYSALKRPG